ncbi:tyrosine-protein kinase TXK-like [Clytia hemisphaerica]|uniref:tyrosine-protein kinase TXK-like n=1 Tax=Clytia hemisphaerica TaxID=252671 RepID=UPI0034D6A563
MESNKHAATVKTKYWCTHKRSLAGKRNQDKRKKERDKQKKQEEYQKRIQAEMEKDEKLRKLESDNALLTRTLKSSKNRKPNKAYSFAKSFLDKSRDKNVTINQTLRITVTEFKKTELTLFPGLLGEGVYGKISLGKLTNFKQTVAVKEISGTKSKLDSLVEAKIMMVLNGHRNLPLLYGIVKPNLILLEFIGDGTMPSSTLKNCLADKPTEINWITIVIDICEALKHIHDNGILHNDLHPRNILLRERKYVKIIDFGKATMVDDPVIYDIQKGSQKQKKYNTKHIHLAYELRNVSRSPQTFKSDIYSLGYNMQLICEAAHLEKLSKISFDLLKEKPEDRPNLPQIIRRCEIIKHSMKIKK